MGRHAICLINIKRLQATQNASIKDQCSRSKFYGKTDELEDALCKLEGNVAPVIRSIIDGGPLPEVGTDNHVLLLFFLAVQKLRTHAAAESIARQASLYFTYLAKEYGKRTGVDIGDARIVFNDDIALGLRAVGDYLPWIRDLDSRILRISCPARFIASDNPVICYNQWCEGIDHTGVTGASCSGIQIFYPLAPNCMIMLFDARVYDVIGQKSGEIFLTDPSDINYLNRLQCVFAQDNLFFSDWNDRERILATLPKVAHLRKVQALKLYVARELISDPSSTVESELLYEFTPMPDIHLKIKFSRIRRQARHVPLLARAEMYRDRMPIESRLPGRQFVIKSTETWRTD